MVFENLKTRYPLLAKTAGYLEKNAPFFKNVLLQIGESQPDWAFGEELCQRAMQINKQNKKKYFDCVQQIIDFSLEFLKLQLELEKTGHYKYSTFAEVAKNEYNNSQIQQSGPVYNWALYFSQFFWLTHNKVFKFFLHDFLPSLNPVGKILEAPVGTGLFMANFLNYHSAWSGVGLDLSETAINFSKNVLRIYNVPEQRFSLVKQDIYLFKTSEKFDVILCGEFLEHLEDPLRVLRKFKSLLQKNGKIFITVAVWAAEPDHIYLYKSPDEVRRQLIQAGFTIEQEMIQKVFAKSPKQERTPINYCAVLTK